MNIIIFLFFLMGPIVHAKNLDIKINAKGSVAEEAKAVLVDLIGKYNLQPYSYTKDIAIESKVIPHSHPVLTLRAEEKDKPDELLGTFIHEQMHWYWIEASPGKDVGPRVDFKNRYSLVPIKPPEGSGDEASTLQHLGVCWLEYRGLIQTVGTERAKKVISEKPYYTWVYKKVLEDTDFIAGVMKKYKMDSPTGR
jgi:hypothetical protein